MTGSLICPSIIYYVQSGVLGRHFTRQVVVSVIVVVCFYLFGHQLFILCSLSWHCTWQVVVYIFVVVVVVVCMFLVIYYMQSGLLGRHCTWQVMPFSGSDRRGFLGSLHCWPLCKDARTMCS